MSNFPIDQFLDYYCSLCEVKLCGDCCILEHNRIHPIVHSVDMNKTTYRNLIAKTKEIETYLHTHQTKTMEDIEDQIKQLEKIAIDLEFKASYVFLDEEDLLFDIFRKLDYQIVSADDEILIKKEFRSLI